jgi:hypothetical protein
MTEYNGWTEAKIKNLKHRLALSKVYRLCHTNAYEYYKRMFNRTTMVIAVLGAFTTVMEGANLLLEQKEIGISISVIISAALTGVLGTYLKTKDHSQLGAGHQEMCKGYNRIILEIENELALDFGERRPGTDFIRSITNTLTEMSTGGQILPTFIFKDTQRQIESGELDLDKIWGDETVVVPVPTTATSVLSSPATNAHVMPPVPPAPPSSPVSSASASSASSTASNSPQPTADMSEDTRINISETVFPSMELRFNDENINRAASKYQINRFG